MLRLIATNRKAKYAFDILRKYTAGIVLKGTEVKALRQDKVRIEDSYARVVNSEVFIYDMYIGEYEHASIESHETNRPRKLLLRKSEINRLERDTQKKGATIIPINIFFNDKNYAKLTIALARGKDDVDKRERIKKREAQRQIRKFTTG